MNAPSSCRNQAAKNQSTLLPRSCLRCGLGPCQFPDDFAPMLDKLDLSASALRAREDAWQDDQPVNIYGALVARPDSLWDTSRLHGVLINEEGDAI